MHTKRSIRTGAPAMLLLFAAAVLAVRLPANASQRASTYSFFDPIVDVARLLDDRFYETPDLSAMQEGAIRGMIEALDDPYTEFVPSRDVAEFEKQVRGNFVGIGAEVRLSPEGFLLIVSPLDGSPAVRAGLRTQDRIVAVNGVPTFQLGTSRVISMLSGEEGTSLRVTVERNESSPLPTKTLEPSIPGEFEFVPSEIDPFASESEPSLLPDTPITMPEPALNSRRFDVEITRRRIETQTVRGLHRDGDEWLYFVHPEEKVAYVRLSQFTAETGRETPRVLFDLVEQGMRGLVLDLRFNGGGSLPASIQIADLFLDEGTIVSVRGASVPENVYEARNEIELPDDLHVAILVNENSASASEIVTGALKDNGRAIVIGERTFGKGLVQQVVSLPSGAGQLKLTEANYYLPSGQNIQRKDDSPTWGVDPSPGFYLPLSIQEEADVWSIRREQEILRPDKDMDPSLWEDADRILAELQDPQLSAAVDALVGKLQTGEFTPANPDGATEATSIQAGLLDIEQERLRALEREMIRSRSRIAALSSGEEKDTETGFPSTDQLRDGTLVLRAADGSILKQYNISGPGLERWLVDAPLEESASDSEEATE